MTRFKHIPLNATWIYTLMMILFSGPAAAGGADVINAVVEYDVKGRYTVTATVLHKDEGREHYVTRFEVLTPEGKVIGARYLGHPHVHEQPLSRSAVSVKIPKDVQEVRVRAYDNVHGFSGKEFVAKVPEGE